MSNLPRDSDESLCVAGYLDALGVCEDEFVGIYWARGDEQHAIVRARDEVAECIEALADKNLNTFLAPNPTAGPSREGTRGNAEQVTRVAAVYADLDCKDGACPNIEAAHQIVDTISACIEERPTVVIFSGGGLQPIWALEDCDPETGTRLLRRFGRLVRAIGQADGIKLDSVFNVDRVLRVPASRNWKYDPPVEVACIADTGAPMDPATLAERLDEYGIGEHDEDKLGLGDVVVAENGWPWAVESCGYSVDVVRKWLTDPVTERHPQLLNWLVRLECMRRNGCLTRIDYDNAQRKLTNRFLDLLSSQEPRRDAKRYEVTELRNVAIDRASRKQNQAEIDDEMGGAGGHVHLFGNRVTEHPKGNRMNATQQPDTAPRATAPAVSAADAAQGGSVPGSDAQTEGVAGEFEADVVARLEALRINEEAKRRLHEEQNPTPELQPVMNLRERLAQPRTQTKYLVQDLSPRGSRTIINAQFKAGKTTIAGNLIRGLVDGDDFLGQFAIHDGPHRVVLIDDELGENQLLDWLDEQGITNQDAVADVIPLRGRVSAFNILDDRVRAMWAERLRTLKTDVLILDCLRPVLDALGLDENREAGRFLVPFDALLYEAGISEAFLIHHMGHANERSRGDSRLQDWPDAIWRLVRENEQPDSARFFSAYGRDVDVPEGRLEYNEATRRLSLTGGSRKQQKAADNEAEARDALVQLMADHYLGQLTDEQGKPLGVTMTTNTVKAQLHERHAIANRRADTALKQCGPRAKGGSGILANTPGPNRALVWSVENPCEACGKPVTDPNASYHMSCVQVTQVSA